MNMNTAIFTQWAGPSHLVSKLGTTTRQPNTDNSENTPVNRS